ncbi:MAG: endo-1,4-beta-xylanase [Uliginosibacterium sp.]|nr:endo-1,4-beta-xylanase [Uliginosibacterium sp.]
MTRIRFMLALLAALALMTSARAEQEEAAELPSLAHAYRDYFPIGVAVSPGQIMAPSTAAYIASQFNMVVAENAMKPVSISRDAQGKYDFAQADAIVDFGVKNGLKVRGHTLIWHQQGAPWMFSTGKGPDDYVDREELIKRMRGYIHDVVGHFKGRVHAWDVVNEIFVPDESVEQVGGWRKSLWYTIIGPEFVELAFKFAHEADPSALLFYNDYGTESPKKRALMLEMIKNLQAKGIPIHGIGHQSHYDCPATRLVRSGSWHRGHRQAWPDQSHHRAGHQPEPRHREVRGGRSHARAAPAAGRPLQELFRDGHAPEEVCIWRRGLGLERRQFLAAELATSPF